MSKAEPLSTADLSMGERDALAGELAFGVLEGEERAQALRLMLSDRDFAARVERWREDSAGLFEAVDEAAPPTGAWAGIEARINPASNDNRRLRWWQGGAIVSGALAAGLAALMLIQPAPAPVAPQAEQFAVAQLSGPIQGLRIAARYDPASATLRVRATGMPATPTEPELWIVPAGGAPVSLGQIDRDGETVIAVAAGHQRLINPASSFSLSMEPRSPQPSAVPTAPFVAEGAIDLI
jgi:anti-sigma-K factor RskA